MHHGAIAAQVPVPQDVEKFLTPSLAIGTMVAFKAAHPPAAAAVIIYVLDAARVEYQGPMYILFPALAGATWMLFVQSILVCGLRCIWAMMMINGTGGNNGKDMAPTKVPVLPTYVNETPRQVGQVSVVVACA